MKKYDVVPDFTLLDHDGTPRTLSTLLVRGPVVLFFYPAALSLGCTEESCHFRDLQGEFEQLGAQPVGISMDSLDRQARFAEKNHLGFPLLVDVDGEVAKLFGVKRSLDFLKVKRATFLIDQDRRVRALIKSEVSMNAHADKALAALGELAGD